MKNLMQIIKKNPENNFNLEREDFLRKKSDPLKYILRLYN